MNHWFKLLRPEDNRLAMRLSKAYIVAIGNLVLPHPSGMIVFRIVAALRSLVLLHTNPVKNNVNQLLVHWTKNKREKQNRRRVIRNLWPVILLSIYFHLPHRISDPAGMSGGLPSRPRSSSSCHSHHKTAFCIGNWQPLRVIAVSCLSNRFTPNDLSISRLKKDVGVSLGWKRRSNFVGRWDHEKRKLRPMPMRPVAAGLIVTKKDRLKTEPVVCVTAA